jgi:thiamine-phosphate pyrophosphorylase
VRSVHRILDANFNRAREALRVLEDLARFHHGDAPTTAALKSARHELDLESRAFARQFLGARDSLQDVGRDGDRPVRGPRLLSEVATANLKRAQEALRAIEEIAKGRYASMSAVAHRLRYALYTIEKSLADPKRRLRAARLYVLLDPAVARGPLVRLAREAVRGGADILQLRQKPHVDLGLARALRAAAGEALFIVNDRPDIALACGADGVHLGLTDMPIADARRLGVGIVGATSHSLSEARRAVAAGADYISVGPVFETPLKPDLRPEGMKYLAGAKKLGVPFFCIGGITWKNVRPEMERVAVCSGVISEKDPAAAARSIRRRLTSSR